MGKRTRNTDAAATDAWETVGIEIMRVLVVVLALFYAIVLLRAIWNWCDANPTATQFVLTLVIVVLTTAVCMYAKKTLRATRASLKATQTSLDFFSKPCVELDWGRQEKSGKHIRVYATISNSSTLAIWVKTGITMAYSHMGPPGTEGRYTANLAISHAQADGSVAVDAGMNRYRVAGCLRIPLFFTLTDIEPECSGETVLSRTRVILSIAYYYREKRFTLGGVYEFQIRMTKGPARKWELLPSLGGASVIKQQ